MKELKCYQKLKKGKLVKRYSDSVKLVILDSKNYILKRIEVPLSKKELLSQYNYVCYLKSNNINVPKIFGYYEEDGKLYEVQEYISGNFCIETEKLIKLLSKYHSISKKYQSEVKKRNIFEMKYKCRNSKLNYLLLGFEEKYNKFPLINIQKNCFYISNDNINIVKKTIAIFNKSYNTFVRKYDINSVIIHNDINSTNVINNTGKLYLIDFDLCIKSSEYVDFVDACMKRYDSLDYIQTNFDKFIIGIKKNIMIYNKYNYNLSLDCNGVYLMCIIKLFSFYFYVMLRKENSNIFNKNINMVYHICYNLYNLIGGNHD